MYIVGNDEYNYYKSNDNGKNWELLNNGSGDIISYGDRIIIYGQNNDGLKYTDDNFATIESSNITDGNWIALENEEVKGLYTTSLDGRGIYYSEDNGNTWERVSPGTGDQIEKDGEKVIIFGKGDVVEFPSGIYTPNAVYKNKTIVQMLAEGVSPEDCLIYILNEIILPGLCSMLTGYKNLKDLNGFYNNEKIYNSFYTDGELYKTSFDGIDFVADVGMMPFDENDIKEYTKAKEELDNIVISEEDDKEIRLLDLLDDKNSRISKTFGILDTLISVYKDFIMRASFENIKEKKEDYEGFNTPEDRDTMREFYEIRKGSEASIVGTIINSVFTFSYSKKMALLKTSIVRTAMDMKDPINQKLNIVRDYINEKVWDGKDYIPKHTTEEILSNNLFDKYFIFNLKKEWAKNIKLSIEDYYKAVSDNINNISKADDKEFISEAADKYSEIRLTLLDSTKDIINEVNPDNYELVELQERKRNSLLNVLENNIRDLINEIDEGTFNDQLDELVKDYYSSVEDLDEYQYRELSNNYKENFLKEFNNKMNLSSINNNSFDKDTFEEYKAMYGTENIDKIFKYYKLIIQEYKNRCYKLLDIISNETVNSFPDQLKVNLDRYINELKRKAPDDRLSYINNNPISYYYVKNTGEKLIFMIKRSWFNMRGKI